MVYRFFRYIERGRNVTNETYVRLDLSMASRVDICRWGSRPSSHLRETNVYFWCHV